jgi:DNA helicase-2/ATP-dependent DNA helicase PcrA
LKNVAAQFDELEPEHALMRFLEDVALMSDADEYDERADAVTLITLHAAKGLEFPVVNRAWRKASCRTSARSTTLPRWEERRLAYVGGRGQGPLTCCAFRRAHGAGRANPPSRF